MVNRQARRHRLLQDDAVPPWLRKYATAGAFIFTCAIWVGDAPAQIIDTAEPQPTGNEFLLRGTADAAGTESRNDIFSDGGIEQANRDSEETPDGTDPEGEGAAVPSANAGTAPEATLDRPQRRERRVQAQSPVTDPINTATPDPRANVREPPEQIGLPRVEEEDPFLPVGFRAGTWQVFTRLEQAVGYATNSSFSAGGRPGPFSQTDANVTIRSDWSRHQATITADGSYRRSWDADGGSGAPGIPSAGITGDLRLDLPDNHTVNLSTGYGYTTESASSASLDANVVNRPGVHTAGASAELVNGGGLLAATLRGSFDRVWFEDAQLSNGSAMSQQDRNNNLYRLTSRLTYAAPPALKPFIQTGIGTRLYDTDVDRNGDDRDSLIFDLRAGLELDFGDRLSGEVALGYLSENYAGANLETIGTPSMNAAIEWSPQRDTVIKYNAATSISGSTTAGDSGSVVQSYNVEAERRIRDNLAVNAIGSVEFDRAWSDGSVDRTYTIGAGVEYWISRFLSVTSDVEYQRFETARPGAAWDSTSVRVGIAVQR